MIAVFDLDGHRETCLRCKPWQLCSIGMRIVTARLDVGEYTARLAKRGQA